MNSSRVGVGVGSEIGDPPVPAPLVSEPARTRDRGEHKSLKAFVSHMNRRIVTGCVSGSSTVFERVNERQSAHSRRVQPPDVFRLRNGAQPGVAQFDGRRVIADEPGTMSSVTRASNPKRSYSLRLAGVVDSRKAGAEPMWSNRC